jgi:transposase
MNWRISWSRQFEQGFGWFKRAGGKRHHDPRLLRAPLIYNYANGFFWSRRLERASYRDIEMRFVATNIHPDHNTIMQFRRSNGAAFEAVFVRVQLRDRPESRA